MRNPVALRVAAGWLLALLVWATESWHRDAQQGMGGRT